MLPAAVAEDHQERQTDLWSACAAEGISSTSRATVIKKYESSDKKCRTSPEFLRLSVAHNDRVLSVKHELTGSLNIGNLGKTDGGTIRDGLKLLQ